MLPIIGKTGKTLCLLIVSALVLTFASCEKEVKINLASVPPRVVVQGEISTDQPPFVMLTSSIGFFSKVDLATLQNSFLHNAVVKVSDGTKTITLREYIIDSGAYKFSFYSLDTANLSNLMFGEAGKFYTLSIDYEGKNYTAVTKIPYPQGFDTMWFAEPEFTSANTPDSARQLFINYTDPDTIGDYVRCYTSRNEGPFYYSANFSDEIVNGKKINKIGLALGYEASSSTGNQDSLIYAFPGEEVTVKWCAVDKGVYVFWNTLDFAKGSVGNPFASPINPVTNLTNGALGIWAGYGTFFKTATVPHN
jgi:hypothetical protein